MTDKRKRFRFFAVLLAGIGVLAIFIVCLVKFMPTGKHMTSEEYFGQLGETEAAVVVEDHIAQERALIQDGNVYIDYTLVERELNSRFYWDASASLLLFTTPTQTFEIAPNTSSYTIDGESFDAGYDILRTTSSGMFLAMNFMQQYSDLICAVYDTPSRVVITYGSESVTTAELKGDTAVRYRGGIKSPIITEATGGSIVTVLDQMDKWSQILTADGYIGYVKNSRLKGIATTTRDTVYASPDYTSIHMDGKVNLVWHQISNMDSNYALSSDIESMTGVNTISPTWFSVASKDGTVSSLADSSYVETAHEKGLEVWGLVDNFNQEVDMKEVLTNTTAREKLTTQLIEAALEYQMDGLNIDFENLGEELGDAYIEFLRELSIQCRKNNLVLSSDNTVPRDFSAYYQRSEQAEVVDYFIIMGYDEHYVGSDPGSVASLSFEKEGIESTIAEGVPADKIISGVPFYTRLWKTDTSGEVSSEAIGMNTADSTLEANGVTANWSDETSQDYAEYHDPDGALYQIWLENEASMELKAKLIPEYQLAGIAAWKLGFERSSIWDVISTNIK